MKTELELLSLKELTTQYCQLRGFVLDHNTARASTRRWDYVIQNGGGAPEGIGITIKDWKRAVGVDIVIRAEQLMKASRYITKVLLVSNHFSDPARSLAEKIGIMLLTKMDIIEILTSQAPKKDPDEPADSEQQLLVH